MVGNLLYYNVKLMCVLIFFLCVWSPLYGVVYWKTDTLFSAVHNEVSDCGFGSHGSDSWLCSTETTRYHRRNRGRSTINVILYIILYIKLH